MIELKQSRTKEAFCDMCEIQGLVMIAVMTFGLLGDILVVSSLVEALETGTGIEPCFGANRRKALSGRRLSGLIFGHLTKYASRFSTTGPAICRTIIGSIT
jgi:hypothetical protein